jgi:hypothetical protein
MAMLSQQFVEGLYAFLVIAPGKGGTTQRQAAFYLAMNGHLPESPSSPVFPFEESAFESLPEVPAEATEDVRNFNFGINRARRPTPWAAIVIFSLLLLLVGAWLFGDRISQNFRPASNQIGLAVVSSGSNLKISWDHSAPAVTNALHATMVITDGRSLRELKLDPDDLKLGQIAYERLTKKVYVVMSIDAPGLKLPPQSFDWTGE